MLQTGSPYGRRRRGPRGGRRAGPRWRRRLFGHEHIQGGTNVCAKVVELQLTRHAGDTSQSLTLCKQDMSFHGRVPGSSCNGGPSRTACARLPQRLNPHPEKVGRALGDVHVVKADVEKAVCAAGSNGDGLEKCSERCGQARWQGLRSPKALWAQAHVTQQEHAAWHSCRGTEARGAGSCCRHKAAACKHLTQAAAVVGGSSLLENTSSVPDSSPWLTPNVIWSGAVPEACHLDGKHRTFR